MSIFGHSLRLGLAASLGGLLLALPAAAQAPDASPPPAATPAPPAATPPAATPAPAAAPAAAPLPRGSALMGRPENEQAKKLAPVAPPPIPTAADKLQLDRLTVPKGFKVEVYVSGIANARTMRWGDKGTLFVSTRQLGNLYAVVEKNGKREIKTIMKGLDRPNGLAFKDGTLYVAEGTKVWKLENIEQNLDSPPQPKMLYDKFPDQDGHGWKFTGIGPDNKLYVSVGQPCNNCIPDEGQGTINRMNLDGSGFEIVAKGVRQSVGFDWNPVNKQLYFTDNSRDWLSEDLPSDELNRITETGKHFGSPYCYQGNFPDPEHGWGRSCDEFEKPVALLGPHSAVLGMRFYTGSMFPASYRNAIFIARHGSWNRSNKIGGDVVVAQLNRDGSVRAVEPFLTGFIQDNKYIGRPVDVLAMKDGSLLVSDDYAGAIYRVSYGSARTAGKKRRR